jgi:hypothetical protein
LGFYEAGMNVAPTGGQAVHQGEVVEIADEDLAPYEVLIQRGILRKVEDLEALGFRRGVQPGATRTERRRARLGIPEAPAPDPEPVVKVKPERQRRGFDEPGVGFDRPATNQKPDKPDKPGKPDRSGSTDDGE